MKEGKIDAIVREGEKLWNSKLSQVIDYQDAVVMPGLIDV